MGAAEIINLREDEIINVDLKYLFIQTIAENELRQVEFAEKLGCTQGTISKIESGRQAPSAALYIKLLRVFKKSGIN